MLALRSGPSVGGNKTVVATTRRASSCAVVRLRSALAFQKPRFHKPLQDKALITKPLLCRLSYGGKYLPYKKLRHCVVRAPAAGSLADRRDDKAVRARSGSLIVPEYPRTASERGSRRWFFEAQAGRRYGGVPVSGSRGGNGGARDAPGGTLWGGGFSGRLLGSLAARRDIRRAGRSRPAGPARGSGTAMHDEVARSSLPAEVLERQ